MLYGATEGKNSALLWISIWALPSAISCWVLSVALSALLRIADSAELIAERDYSHLVELMTVETKIRLDQRQTEMQSDTPAISENPQLEAAPATQAELNVPNFMTTVPFGETTVAPERNEVSEHAMTEFHRYCAEVDAKVFDQKERQRMKLEAADQLLGDGPV